MSSVQVRRGKCRVTGCVDALKLHLRSTISHTIVLGIVDGLLGVKNVFIKRVGRFIIMFSVGIIEKYGWIIFNFGYNIARISSTIYYWVYFNIQCTVNKQYDVG